MDQANGRSCAGWLRCGGAVVAPEADDALGGGEAGADDKHCARGRCLPGGRKLGPSRRVVGERLGERLAPRVPEVELLAANTEAPRGGVGADRKDESTCLRHMSRSGCANSGLGARASGLWPMAARAYLQRG